MNLPSQLLRLSEGGEPALTHAPEPGSPDAHAFSRLAKLGVLERLEDLDTWDACEGCDCGAVERQVRWLGDKPAAICPLDAARDTVLLAHQVAMYRLRPALLALQIAQAAGVDRVPDEVVPGIWLAGRLADERSLVIATSSVALRQPATIDRLKSIDRSARIAMIGHVSSATAVSTLRERGIDVVPPDEVFLPGLSGRPFAVDRNRLFPMPTGQPRLSIDRAGRSFVLDGRPLRLSDQSARLLDALADAALGSARFLTQTEVQAAVYGALRLPDSRPLRDVARDLRNQLAEGLGGADAEAVRQLIENKRVEQYRLKLKPEEIAIAG